MTGKHTRLLSQVGLVLTLSSGVSYGEGLTFDFKDPKGVNSMTFVLDSLLEPIMGMASGVSGKITFDPADPGAASGEIAVDATSLHVMNEKMKEVLHGEDWLDVKKHPTISFRFDKVKNVHTAENQVFSFTAVGDFTCKGTTRRLEIPVSATFLAGQLEKRLRDAKGDLLIVRSEFKIDRKDFGIKPDTGAAIVAEDITVRVAIVGCAFAESENAQGD